MLLHNPLYSPSYIIIHEQKKIARSSITNIFEAFQQHSIPTQISRHIFDRRKFTGVGNTHTSVGGRKKSTGLTKASFARANHIDLLPTWLIGSARA